MEVVVTFKTIIEEDEAVDVSRETTTATITTMEVAITISTPIETEEIPMVPLEETNNNINTKAKETKVTETKGTITVAFTTAVQGTQPGMAHQRAIKVMEGTKPSTLKDIIWMEFIGTTIRADPKISRTLTLLTPNRKKIFYLFQSRRKTRIRILFQ